VSSYTSKLLLITALLAIVGGLLFQFWIPQHYLDIFPYTLVFFFLATWLSHYYVIRTISSKSSSFGIAFMISSTLRLFVYSGFIGAYLYFNRGNAKPFLVAFCLLYFIYTVIDVRYLLIETTRKK